MRVEIEPGKLTRDYRLLVYRGGEPVISTDGSSTLAALEVILAVFLVFLNGFFVAAEFAIVKVRTTRLQQLADEGNKRAKVALTVVHHLDEHLSATQLGITLASLALGWIGEPALADLVAYPLHVLSRWIPGLSSPLAIHTVSVVVAFSFITMLHIVLGELVPKSLSIAKAEAVTLWCAPPLRLFYGLFRLPIAVLNNMANAILRLVDLGPASEHEFVHSNEELRMLVTASAAGGELDETERVLIDNVFGFSERVAREIMVPRNEMVCFFTDDSLEENLAVARDAGHTRFPLCEEDKDNVIGMIHLRDLFRTQKDLRDLRSIMRPVMVLPETLSVSRVLKELQHQKTQMAILVDEYGGTAGMVTLEDLVEEIVGEIQDEFDQEEKPEVQQVAPNSYEVDGAMLIEDARAELGLDPEEVEGVDTVGGYIFSVLGEKPAVGQQVQVGKHSLQVIEVEGLRITRVRVVLESNMAAVPRTAEES